MVRALWSVVGLVCLLDAAFGLPPGDPSSWEIQASLFTSSAKDTQNSLGVDDVADDGLDLNDVLDPPGLPGRLCLRVEHEDGLPRARDIGLPLTSSRSWHLTATNLQAGAFHFILFSGLESIPAEYSVLLVDPTAAVQHDLHSAPQYLFLPAPGEQERSFELRVLNPPPRPPDGLSVIPGTACADLSWEGDPEPDVVGYTIYMGTASGVYDRSWYVGMQSGVQVTDLEYGSTYYFSVSALDRSNLEGELSPEAELAMQVDPTPTPIPEAVMTFDMDQNGHIDYRDLFSLANSWMYPVKLTPTGQRPVFRNVSPSLLNEFVTEWQSFRPTKTTQKPAPALPAMEERQ